MNKSIFTTLILLFAAVSSFAQSADEILNKVSRTYQKADAYYIKFEFKDSQSKKTETGELFAAKEKYNVAVMDIRQLYDGKNLYTISKQDKEVTVSQPSPDSNDFLSPTRVLDIYKTNFKAAVTKTETVNGRKVIRLKLTPGSDSEIEYAVLGVYTDDYTLCDYTEYLSDGGSRTFTIKEYLENLIIPKALFKFDQSKFESEGYIVTPI